MQRSRIGEMKGLLERGLRTAKEKGADEAKIGFWQTERISASFENARLKTTDTRQSLGYQVEVLVAKRRGNTQGSEIGDLDEMIGRAVSLARVGSVAHFKAYPAPSAVTRVRTHSPRTLGLSRDEMILAATRIVSALKALDAGMFIEAWSSRGESEGLVVTSGGVCRESAHTDWSLGGGYHRVRGTDMLMGGYGRGWRDLNEYFDPEFISNKMITDLKRSERSAEPPSGASTVILPPELAAQFLWPVMMGVNGRNVAKGDSPLKGRLGERILDPGISVIDDPHLDFSGGAAETDGNGIPTRRFEIVREGVLKAFLYDLDSAGLAGAEPTGHDNCGPHSLALMPGTKSRTALFGLVKDGLYVKDLIGFGQSNMMNGDVSGNVALGFRIANGEIVGRVKDTMIAGNVYEIMKEGVELSSEVDPVSRMPYMKLSGVSVSSAKK